MISYLKDPLAGSPFAAPLYGAMLAAVQLAGHSSSVLSEAETGRKRWPAMLLQDDAVEEAVARLDRLEVRMVER